jgi:hypothetical protein
MKFLFPIFADRDSSFSQIYDFKTSLISEVLFSLNHLNYLKVSQICDLKYSFNFGNTIQFEPFKLLKSLRGFFFNLNFFYVRYSTLLHLPPLRFHCVGECWNRTQDCYDLGIDSRTL